VAIAIAAGVEDGQVIKITGMGEAGEQGAPGGDLYVVVRVKPHKAFLRKKQDLYTQKEVRLTDAALGRSVPIVDIGGERIAVAVPPGWDVREPVRVPGRGMPRFGGFGRGDLYVVLNLKMPRHLSAKAKRLLGELEGEL
jgi:molecular chaperone DnaJ